MPEIKNNFLQGKMNKDLDERLIPNGQYRDALNVEIATAEDAGVGTIKNILGNKRVETIIPSEFKCVGSIADEKHNKLYWFVTTYEKDAIIEYDVENDIVSPLIVDLNAGNFNAVLKFSGNIITGINIIDNLLFWTDNRSDPKKINIDECKKGTDDFDTHTKLLYDNGSFHGMTIQLVTAYSSGTLDIQRKNGRYFWFEKKHIRKILVANEGEDRFAFNRSKFLGDPYQEYRIRHYRDGKFLGKKRIKILNDTKGAYARNENLGAYGNPETNNDWYIGDVIFGENVKLDIEERHITVIKPKPLNAPSVKINYGPKIGSDKSLSILRGRARQMSHPYNTQLYTHNVENLSSDGDSVSSIPNLFETKFPRFSYRYKYRDGEFSALAPFTNPVFNPKYTKDTNQSNNTDVFLNKDTAYDIKEPYNKAMVNSIHSVELTDFITAQTPEDVVEVDILYKQEDSPVIYSIGTIKHIDPEWHDWSNNQGYTLGMGRAGNKIAYAAEGGVTKGKYTVTTENIYAALPAN